MISLSFVTGRVYGGQTQAHQIWVSADASLNVAHLGRNHDTLLEIMRIMQDERGLHDSAATYLAPHRWLYKHGGNSHTFMQYDNRDGLIVGLHACNAPFLVPTDPNQDRGPSHLRNIHFRLLAERILDTYPEVELAPDSVMISNAARARHVTARQRLKAVVQ